MNDKQENRELEQATPTVTPPPFRQSDEPHEAQQQEPSASPTLADRIAAMNLDEDATRQLQQLTQDLDNAIVSHELLSTLAQGLTHDTDVQNADAAGYLRGRNEKIEAVLHPQTLVEDESPTTPVFPRYCRRSIWE